MRRLHKRKGIFHRGGSSTTPSLKSMPFYSFACWHCLLSLKSMSLRESVFGLLLGFHCLSSLFTIMFLRVFPSLTLIFHYKANYLLF